MRVLANIPHPTYSITAFTLEKYYYIEIEAGPMKQCYKLHKETTDGLEGIKKWLSGGFLEEVQRIFEEMYRNHKKAMEAAGS